MNEITAESLGERLVDGEEPGPVVLDIRPGEEFEDWHIPGSINVDVYGSLKEDPDQAREALETLPANQEIVTVCASGVVSETATRVLREMGYDAFTLVDGLEGWSRVHLDAAIGFEGSGTLLQVARPGTGCLSYVLVSEGEAAVFDPSQYIEVYEELIDHRGAELTGVFETHAHADHVSGARQLAVSRGVPHYRHPRDQGDFGDITQLEDGERLRVGETSIEILHTPGHTPGSVVFNVEDSLLLTGDTLFFEGVGRPDLEDGTDEVIRGRTETLYGSLERMFSLPDEMLLGPAHDPGNPLPPVTQPLGETRTRNESLSWDRESFIERVTGSIPEPPANHDRIKRVNKGFESLDANEAETLELGPNRCAAG